MKLMIKVFSALLVLLVLTGAVAYYVLPKQNEVEQSLVIEATPDKVFHYISNPILWEEWSALNKANDPSMIHLYGGPMSGAGARHRWSGDKAGNGHMVFTEASGPAFLAYEQTKEGYPHKTTGNFKLEATENGTKVTWFQVTPLDDSPVAVIKGAFAKKAAEKDVTEGLNGLKNVFVKNTKKRASRK